MPQFTVPIVGPNGSGSGTITVNASDSAAAAVNAGQGGNTVAGTPSLVGGGGTTTTSSGGGGGGSNSDAAAALGAIQNNILAAIGSGNKAAADEAAKEFSQTFGLDTNKFQESVRQYNQNFTLAQAGVLGYYTPPGGSASGGSAGGGGGPSYFVGTDGRVHTGTPQGTGQAGWGSAQGVMADSSWAPGAVSSDPNVFLQPQSASNQTQQQQQSNVNNSTAPAGNPTGLNLPPGAIPTEASREFNATQAEQARQFDVSQGNTALDNANKTALGVLTLTAGLHSDPFRQLNVMYGANGNSGLNAAVNGLTGQYGLPGSFTAPAGANSANLAGLTNEFSNAGSGTQLAAGTGLNNTNQIIARNYNAAPQNVKDAATSALSMNTGVDQSAVDKQIQNNLPKYTSPDFGLATV